MMYTAWFYSGQTDYVESNAPYTVNGKRRGYKAAHKKHPTTLWISSSIDNYNFAGEIGMCLALEYKKRFGKVHACSKHILWLYENKPSHFELRESETAYYPTRDFKPGLTRIPACMPDKYKVQSIIESYKLYYTGEKESLRDILEFNLNLYYKMNWRRFHRRFCKRLRKKRKKVVEFIENHAFNLFLISYLIIMVTLPIVNRIFSSPPIKIEKKPEYEHRIYSDFIRGVKKNEITKVEVDPNKDVVYFEERNGTIATSYYVPSEDFWKTMSESQVDFDLIRIPSGGNMTEFISFMFITIGFFAIFRMIFGANGVNQNPFSMMKNDIDVEKQIQTRFEDVQGIDSAKDELEEIVDFLREPEKNSLVRVLKYHVVHY